MDALAAIESHHEHDMDMIREAGIPLLPKISGETTAGSHVDSRPRLKTAVGGDYRISQSIEGSHPLVTQKRIICHIIGIMIREPFPFSTIDFQVFGRMSVSEIDPGVPHVLVSITDPGAPEAELAPSETRLAVLRLQFWDTDDPDTTLNGGITQAQAKQIVAFIQEHKEQIQRIVCQCEAGVSRSAGVASGLSYWLNGDDSPFYSYFVPNFLCRRRVLEAIYEPLEATEELP